MCVFFFLAKVIQPCFLFRPTSGPGAVSSTSHRGKRILRWSTLQDLSYLDVWMYAHVSLTIVRTTSADHLSQNDCLRSFMFKTWSSKRRLSFLQSTYAWDCLSIYYRNTFPRENKHSNICVLEQMYFKRYCTKSLRTARAIAKTVRFRGRTREEQDKEY